MPETRVPMTLRDHFLEDPFFTSAWEDMENMRNSFFQSSNMIENKESSSSVVEKKDDSERKNMFGRWMMPRKWLLPSAMSEWKNDSGVLSYKDGADKMEISLNTSGYTPSELSVNVGDGELIISGAHEERSEAGHRMVSRQFRRQYALGQDVDISKVVSNLSQDGVLVVTIPKDKKIQEVQEDKKKITLEQKQAGEKQSSSSQSMNVERRSSFGRQAEEEKSSQNINVERRSSTESEKSNCSTLGRRSSAEKKSSLESSQKINVERNSSLGNPKKTKTSSLVPMNLRDSFFDDPFFHDNWMDIQESQKSFFSKAEEAFKKRMDLMESSMNERFSLSKFFDMDRDWMKMPELSKMSLEDNHELKIVNDEDKLEIHLDTVGYKPDELKVLVGDGVVSVEGKHEERTEDGESVMVSRQMKRQYPLPAGAQYDQVNSNLSKDGVLIISVPKSKTIKQQDRHVPIKMN